ncbi:MAG: bifunctional (p)ppGpp synthetase/guanosine-3',5'-bis(diphosphate) 3'-pyrophosphohydrolase [Clostridia bacterium]|nr:bifunctional (p)ppGpp synthetase/guanosine-3',5'-bis(diphosphate) 3'-pyrophosphohydrolase [Clostridia bacterium]
MKNEKETALPRGRLLDEAIVFAADAHAGMTRKDGKTPYILHPLEVAAIAGTITNDPEVLAAAVLHDTVEDTPASIKELEDRFGTRVAALVASETENKRPGVPPAQTWQIRKEESLKVLKDAEDPGVRILWLSDKLSNMRSFLRMYRREGKDFLLRLHESDPEKQARYYRTVAEYTGDLSGTDAWREYAELIERVFEGVEQNG